MHGWVSRFALLADPTRLTLLLCIHEVGEICVSDLALAAGLKDTTTRQALRLLRAQNLVSAHRDGRVVRYRLADPVVTDLLDRMREGPYEALGGHARSTSARICSSRRASMRNASWPYGESIRRTSPAPGMRAASSSCWCSG